LQVEDLEIHVRACHLVRFSEVWVAVIEIEAQVEVKLNVLEQCWAKRAARGFGIMGAEPIQGLLGMRFKTEQLPIC
jgi:hypothetical protein